MAKKGTENVIGKGFDKRPENINRKGRPKKIPKLEELIINVLGEEKDGMTAMEAIVRALRRKAISGDITASRELLDRAYGKAKQYVDYSVPGETPEIRVIVTKESVGEAFKKLENNGGMPDDKH